jgi:hypothetical protein
MKFVFNQFYFLNCLDIYRFNVKTQIKGNFRFTNNDAVGIKSF